MEEEKEMSGGRKQSKLSKWKRKRKKKKWPWCVFGMSLKSDVPRTGRRRDRRKLSLQSWKSRKKKKRPRRGWT